MKRREPLRDLGTELAKHRAQGGKPGRKAGRRGVGLEHGGPEVSGDEKR